MATMPAASLPETMRAVQVAEFNAPYTLNPAAPVPHPTGPHDLIVKVAAASYCHTDGMVRAGVFGAGIALPLTASHEGAGTVAAVGPAVSAFGVGDRVMCGLPLHPCGACDDCAGPDEGRRQYCANVAGHVGVRVDGCLAEYVRVDERFTTRLPDQVSFLSAAPLACAGRTVWRGIQQTGLLTNQSAGKGKWVAIIGAGGGLGHLGIQFAKAQGLRVIGVDARDEGLELARLHGADLVVDARRPKEDVARQVREVVGSGGAGGADASVVLSDAPGAAALGAALTRMHGTLVQIAQPDEVALPFQELIIRDVRVRGSVLCSPRESDEMVAFVAERGIGVSTVRFQGLEAIEQLLGVVESGRLKGKAVVVVDPEQVDADRKLGATF